LGFLHFSNKKVSFRIFSKKIKIFIYDFRKFPPKPYHTADTLQCLHVTSLSFIKHIQQKSQKYKTQIHTLMPEQINQKQNNQYLSTHHQPWINFYKYLVRLFSENPAQMEKIK